jgi:hypothetical protein
MPESQGEWGTFDGERIGQKDVGQPWRRTPNRCPLDVR